MRILQSLLKTKYNSKISGIFASISKNRFGVTNANKKISNGLIIKRKFSSLSGGKGPNNDEDEEIHILLCLGFIYLLAFGSPSDSKKN